MKLIIYTSLFVLLFSTLVMGIETSDRILVYRFVHGSDLHLNDSEGGNATADIIWFVNQVNSLGLVNRTFLTGDLINGDTSTDKYTELKGYLDVLNNPYNITNGNHDNIVNLESIFGSVNYSIEEGGYKFIVLTVGGSSVFLLNSQLEFLERELDESPDTPTFIFHHVSMVNFTSSNLEFDNTSYQDIVKDHSNVKAIFTGHKHSSKECVYNSNAWNCHSGSVYNNSGVFNGYRVVDIFNDTSIDTYHINYASGYTNTTIQDNCSIPSSGNFTINMNYNCRYTNQNIDISSVWINIINDGVAVFENMIMSVLGLVWSSGIQSRIELVGLNNSITFMG